MLFAGIDPGLTGGITAIDEHGSPIWGEKFTSWSKIYERLTAWEGASGVLIALENVNAMPGQGVVSMFNFGANFGGWKALLEGLKIPHVLIRPQKWQKALLGSFPKGEAKAKAYDLISRRFPSLQLNKSDSGLIDSLCLALYIKDNH